jgi:hypothetical protein
MKSFLILVILSTFVSCASTKNRETERKEGPKQNQMTQFRQQNNSFRF